MTLAAETVRLFFALWPTETVRDQLALALKDSLQQLPGRHVPAADWHITLAFLGHVPAIQIPCVEAAGAAVRAASFELQLDRWGYFRTSRVFWFGASQCPTALSALVNRLQVSMVSCDVGLDSRSFVAHLTLVRKLTRRPELDPVPAFRWSIDSIALVESALSPTGARYRVRQRWPLHAASADESG